MNQLAIEIRHATRADAEGLSLVHEEAWRGAYAGVIPGIYLSRMVSRRGPAWWARLAERAHGALLVLDLGEKLVGYVTLGSARTVPGVRASGEVFELYIKPECQGLGFGSKLFSAALERLSIAGRKPALVWSLADNEAAARFYRRQGGRPVARSVESFGDTQLPKIGFLFQN